MFILSNNRANLSWHVSTHAPKISLQDADWEIFLNGLYSCLEVGCRFSSCSILILHCKCSEIMSVCSRSQRRFLLWGSGGFISDLWQKSSDPSGRRKMQRVVDFLSYIIIGQGKIHVCSTYTCVSGSAQCSTEVWTVRKMLVRKT